MEMIIIDSLCSYIQEKFYDKNVKIEIFQSNYEGRIIDILQNAYYEKLTGLLLIRELILITAMQFMML